MHGVWQARRTSRQRRPGSGRTYIEPWDWGAVNVALVSTQVAPETRGVGEVSLETEEKKGSRDGRWQGCPRLRKWSGQIKPREQAGDSKHPGGPWGDRCGRRKSQWEMRSKIRVGRP